MGKWANVCSSHLQIAGEFLKIGLLTASRYLKCIDRFYNNYVSCFITAGSKLIYSSLSIHVAMESQ